MRLTLQRSQPGPWGLRLQGGADFEKALVISHVTEGSPSHASGLRVRLHWQYCSEMREKYLCCPSLEMFCWRSMVPSVA